MEYGDIYLAVQYRLLVCFRIQHGITQSFTSWPHTAATREA